MLSIAHLVISREERPVFSITRYCFVYFISGCTRVVSDIISEAVSHLLVLNSQALL